MTHSERNIEIVRRLTPPVVVAGLVLVAMLVVPSASFAAFVRPFVRQLTGAPIGAGGAEVPFEWPSSAERSRGVAVDSEDNLWVGDGEAQLVEFDPSGSFVPFGVLKPPVVTLEGHVAAPEKLAIDTANGDFYVTDARQSVGVFTNTGVLVEQWSRSFERTPAIAIDNSTEPSSGSVYVAYGTELEGAVSKFNAAGEPVNFSCLGSDHISTAPPVGQITATVAVDAHGNIYAGNEEFNSCGQLIHTFAGGETPGLHEGREFDGFGGAITGIAVDTSVSGQTHLLVGVTRFGSAGPGTGGSEPVEGAVDEFDASSGRFLTQITETSDGRSLHSAYGMAVDSHGQLYIVDRGYTEHTSAQEHVVDVLGPGRFEPGVRPAAVTQSKPTSVVLNGLVNPEADANPEASGLSDCHFEYVTESAYEATGFADLSSGGKAPCVPAAGSIPADSTYHAVDAAIHEHVTSGVTYRYRLVATTAGALGGTTLGPTLAFTAPSAPRIDSFGAENLSSTFVDLHAQIDPLGADTTYRFDYLTQTAYEANGDSFSGPNRPTSAPVPAGDIGAGGATGSSDENVMQQLGGLTPDTAYRFRVVAINEIGASTSPAATFTTLPQAAPGLPDGRAYELVTPVDKGDAVDLFADTGPSHTFPNPDVGFASPSGNQFLLSTTLAAFGPFPAAENNAYVFSRTSTGWTYTSLASPLLGVQSILVGAFDPVDFSQVGVLDYAGSYSSPEGMRRTSLVGSPGGPYESLRADVPVHTESEEVERTKIVGASHDLSHVVLESLNDTLAPGAETQDAGSSALYESVGGALNLVNVNSEGELVSRCGAVLGQGHAEGTTHNAVSADGSRVVFTAPDPYAKNDGTGCWDGASFDPPELYMRSGGTTMELSAPEAGAPEAKAHHLTYYAGASEDDSRIFFSTEGELTKDDEGIHDVELYEYDVEKPEGERLTRISAGESGKAAAGVWNISAVSADGSTVYFTASGRLTAAAPEKIQEGEVDLYHYETATRAIAYVATVSRDDYSRTDLSGWGPTPWTSMIHDANWYTTPDGRYLLFASIGDLTGYSTVEAAPNDCENLATGGTLHPNCAEVYRYDSVAGSLICVSCNPSGAAPTSNAEFARSAPGTPGDGAVRAMSDDGSYVFFDTGEALAPKDTNGTLDVYEWHDDRVSLITSGADLAASFFLGASADGSDVFFGTHARLVPQDIDSSGDLYDARICTEADPCVKPPAGETAQCEGDACQNAPAAPIASTPASLSFSGAGNLTGAPAAPGVAVAPRAKVPSAASRLAAALKACRKKPKRKRAVCDGQARKKYVPATKRGKR